MYKLNKYSKLELAKIVQNYYYRSIKEEAIFQFLLVQILRQNDFTVVVNEKSGNKTVFEQYLYKVVGNISGVPDLFIHSKDNRVKGFYLELKKAKNTVYKRNGIYKSFKDNSTIANQIKFLEKANSENYKSAFCYPENVRDILKQFFNIEL